MGGKLLTPNQIGCIASELQTVEVAAVKNEGPSTPCCYTFCIPYPVPPLESSYERGRVVWYTVLFRHLCLDRFTWGNLKIHSFNSVFRTFTLLAVLYQHMQGFCVQIRAKIFSDGAPSAEMIFLQLPTSICTDTPDPVWFCSVEGIRAAGALSCLDSCLYYYSKWINT